MPILSIDETWAGQTGSMENDNSRTYAREFRVVTDDPRYDPAEIGSAAGIPLLWSRHPVDVVCFCDKISVKRLKSSREVWTVTATYTNKVDEDDEPEDNPLNRPWKLSWTSQAFTHVAHQGIKLETVKADGTTILGRPARVEGPIVNSAGDQFDPPVEIESSNWQFTAKKNVAVVPAWLMGYRDALNDAQIQIAGIIFEEHELRINGMSIGEYTYENDVGFFPFEVQVAQKKETWVRDLLDQGTHQITTINQAGTPTVARLRVVDGKGQHVTEPVRLDGQGVQLVPPDAPIEESIFIRYQVYLKSRPYSALSLPTN